jgi:hypothetical protein
VVLSAVDRTALALVSVGAYGLGPPAIHFVHGDLAKGIGSIALRVGMPVAGFGLVYFPSGHRIEDAFVGALAGRWLSMPPHSGGNAGRGPKESGFCRAWR